MAFDDWACLLLLEALGLTSFTSTWLTASDVLLIADGITQMSNDQSFLSHISHFWFSGALLG